MKPRVLPLIVFLFFLLLSCGYENGPTGIPDVDLVSLPNAPSDVTAIQTEDGVIQVTWTDNARNEEEGFVISRGDRKFGWVVIDTLGKDVTSYVDAKRSEHWQKSISYLVWAYNKNGDSEVAVSNELVLR